MAQPGLLVPLSIGDRPAQKKSRGWGHGVRLLCENTRLLLDLCLLPPARFPSWTRPAHPLDWRREWPGIVRSLLRNGLFEGIACLVGFGPELRTGSLSPRARAGQ